MKYLKVFENKEDGCWILIKMEGGLPEYTHLFQDEENFDNYVINLIHDYVKTKENKDNYSCKDIFDPLELIGHWNEITYDGNEIHCDFIKYSSKIELDPELKMRMDAKKYNL